MRRPKETATQDMFSDSDRRFLATIDTLEPAQISEGKWNKLYALLAVLRKETRNNYYIYRGTKWELDVSDRSSCQTERYSATIGSIIESKKRG